MKAFLFSVLIAFSFILSIKNAVIFGAYCNGKVGFERTLLIFFLFWILNHMKNKLQPNPDAPQNLNPIYNQPPDFVSSTTNGKVCFSSKKLFFCF